MPLGILDDLTIRRSQLPEIVPVSGHYRRSDPGRPASRAPAGESGGRAADQPVDDETGGQQAGGPLSETVRVGGDEGLALRVGREECRVGERDRERLARDWSGTPRRSGASPCPRRRRAGKSPGQISATAYRPTRDAGRGDHRELRPPTDPGQRGRQPGILAHAKPGAHSTRSRISRRGRRGVAPIRLVRPGAPAIGERRQVSRRGQRPAQPVIPARMALHAVQDHDLPLRRPGWRPDRDRAKDSHRTPRMSAPRRGRRLSHTGSPGSGRSSPRARPGRLRRPAPGRPGDCAQPP